MRDAEVRFYFDADVLGLAHVVCGLRSDATYPGDPGAIIKRRRRPACVITTPSTRDTEWIPRVAASGLVTVTRDANIIAHRSELSLVRQHSGRLVVLSSAEATSPWPQLEILMSRWRDIERWSTTPGPWVLNTSRTSLRPIDLDAILDA